MTKFESGLTCLVTVRAQSVNMLHIRLKTTCVNNFDFDLTCDVIGDLEVNEIRFRLTVLAGLSKTVSISKIGPVVSEIGGGL